MLPTYDRGDYVLRTSLLCAGVYMELKNYLEKFMITMAEDCRLLSLSPRKSPEYTWAVSEGITLKLYNNFLKYLGINPYKGLNGDQLRALFIIMYLRRNDRLYKTMWVRIFLSILIRGGFTPSLCEYAPLKPQAYVLFFKAAPYGLAWLLWPVYKICEMIFTYRFFKEINEVSIERSTTNKISALLTAKILGIEGLPSEAYAKRVYEAYFKNDLAFIGDACYKGYKHYADL